MSNTVENIRSAMLWLLPLSSPHANYANAEAFLPLDQLEILGLAIWVVAHAVNPRREWTVP